MTKELQHLEELLIARRLAARDDFRGCSLDEVRELESRYAVTLPTFYTEFLLRMGRGAGAYMRGSDVFYPELLQVRRYAEELLREAGVNFQLGQNDFVFFVHQGYQFAYFQTDTSDDPPVWYFYETWKSPEKRKSLSAFLYAVAGEMQGDT